VPPETGGGAVDATTVLPNVGCSDPKGPVGVAVPNELLLQPVGAARATAASAAATPAGLKLGTLWLG
jgi:hypothetical protein